MLSGSSSICDSRPFVGWCIQSQKKPSASSDCWNYASISSVLPKPSFLLGEISGSKFKAIQIFNSSYFHRPKTARRSHPKMAFKRLMKEWECWDQKSPNRAMEEFGTFDEEQQLWKLHPQPLAEEKVDYLSWEAELRVSSGPFRGASFVYILNYPRDYPFKPPTLKVAFTGFPVAYQDIQEGWYVYMVPPRSTSGQRVAGAVTDAKDGGMTVQWKQQRLGNGCFGEGVDCWILWREVTRQ